MKQANIQLVMDNHQNTVLKKHVTPAEIIVLVGMFAKKAGGDGAIKRLVEVEDVKRTELEEKRRLQEIYGAKRVEAIFPGKMPRMPETFEEAQEVGGETSVEDRNLVDVDLAKI